MGAESENAPGSGCKHLTRNELRYYKLECVSLKNKKAYVKRKCKTRIEIVGAGEPRPQSVRVGEPNPYEDSVAVARFLNMNQ